LASTHLARVQFKHASNAPRIAIGLPVRKASPVEFWISMMQLLPPLNVKLAYIIQKGADSKDGKLPAEARNAILAKAAEDGYQYVFFLDDDVIFPDMALYRLWVAMQKHPEAACITGIYPTKADPCEPLLYAGPEGGAFWDWPLGGLVPVHSAGAGCMLVNLAYVEKLEPPWFNDVVVDHANDDNRRQTWGHDRFFHNRLRDEAGGVIYADTGVLCAHWDIENQRYYVIPPDAPCFQRPPVGESFVPFVNATGDLAFTRFLQPPGGDQRFVGYLDWLSREQTTPASVERLNMVEATT
jgi:hypothetical protein